MAAPFLLTPIFFLMSKYMRHDVYGHIGEQILRFGISSDTDKYKMKNILLADISGDPDKTAKLERYFSGCSAETPR